MPVSQTLTVSDLKVAWPLHCARFEPLIQFNAGIIAGIDGVDILWKHAATWGSMGQHGAAPGAESL